ncbi:MAG TPA: LLM class F420-dependent oxidoreductase, partial [Acidimicrobiaceae bacterium]|nr:LLM class F420-dependent oxidoreductase [Acidimicrobiaceae bacterium]
QMTEKIDDDLVDLLCVSGTPAEVGAKLKDRNQFADRSTMMFYGAPPDPDAIADTVKAARS